MPVGFSPEGPTRRPSHGAKQKSVRVWRLKDVPSGFVPPDVPLGLPFVIAAGSPLPWPCGQENGADEVHPRGDGFVGDEVGREPHPGQGYTAGRDQPQGWGIVEAPNTPRQTVHSCRMAFRPSVRRARVSAGASPPRDVNDLETSNARRARRPAYANEEFHPPEVCCSVGPPSNTENA